MTTKRMFSLDVLRGLAILLVLIRHFPATNLASTGPLEWLTLWLINIGWIGVDLFFVLSGFLISGLIYREYEKHGSFDPWRFFLRRGFKIWPAYFVAYGGMTLLRIAAEAWKGHPERSLDLAKQAVCNGLFLQNYLHCERWSHSWSLAVEEHFYAALALLLGWAVWRGARCGYRASRTFKLVLPLAAAVALLALALRFAVCFPDYADWGKAYYQSHMRADALLCGVALGYVVRYRLSGGIRAVARWPWVVLALASAALWPTLFPHGESPWSETLGLSLIYLSFAVVVLAAALNPDFGIRAAGIAGSLYRVLAWLGIYSYTIYLAHSILFGLPGFETLRQMAMALLLRFIPDALVLWVDRAVFLGCSIALGVLLAYFVERPFLRLREHVLPSRSRADSYLLNRNEA